MIKLLIVDDEKIIRETISRHIPWNSMGIEIIGTAKDGIEAYSIILDEYPDIVITDIKMPGLSGLELLERIKKINVDVEFIILSGHGEFNFAKEAMQWGVRHYLLKPCNEDQIIKSVREVMNDIGKKRAFQSSSSHRDLEHTMILNIINEGAAHGSDGAVSDFTSIYRPYCKFLDFDKEEYQLCYLYFVDEASLQECLEAVRSFREKAAPGIPFHILYVHQTLLFFFSSYRYEYDELDYCMNNLHLQGQEISCDYRRISYSCLGRLLNTVIQKIIRYETIYYDNAGTLISLCNYRSIIRETECLTSCLYDRDQKTAENALASLFELLTKITDPVFLKQLVSSVIMLSASKNYNYSTLEATEFLLVINSLQNCSEIFSHLNIQLNKIFLDYHAVSSFHGALSSKIDDYVQRNLSDTNLSLKWISENVLYMNVDYVSKKFFKETGQKFSFYLTNLRIQKAKELMADSGCDKIQFIAETVGCGNNPQYFSQLFKKATGMTPSGYIKYISGGKQNETERTTKQN